MKKMLSKRQVKELVLYSPQHIARLEAAGQFPKRVRLGVNRVGWIEEEVLAWLDERIRHFQQRGLYPIRDRAILERRLTLEIAYEGADAYRLAAPSA